MVRFIQNILFLCFSQNVYQQFHLCPSDFVFQPCFLPPSTLPTFYTEVNKIFFLHIAHFWRNFEHSHLSALLKADSLPSEGNLYMLLYLKWKKDKTKSWVVKDVCSITMELLTQFPGQNTAHRDVTVDFYITARSSAFRWKLCFYS